MADTDLNKRIAALETRLRSVELASPEMKKDLAAFSAGDCTNGCTDVCTRGCTNGCTGSCAFETELGGAVQ